MPLSRPGASSLSTDNKNKNVGITVLVRSLPFISLLKNSSICCFWKPSDGVGDTQFSLLFFRPLMELCLEGSFAWLANSAGAITWIYVMAHMVYTCQSTKPYA